MTFGRVSIKEAFFRVGFPGGLFLHHIDSKLLTRGGGAVVHLNGMHSGCRGGVIFSPVVEFWLEVSKKKTCRTLLGDSHFEHNFSWRFCWKIIFLSL